MLTFTVRAQIQDIHLDIGSSDRRSMRTEHTKRAHPFFAAHVWKNEEQGGKGEITEQRHADE